MTSVVFSNKHVSCFQAGRLCSTKLHYNVVLSHLTFIRKRCSLYDLGYRTWKYCDFSYISMNCKVNFSSNNLDFLSEYFLSHNLRQFNLTFTLIISTFRLAILNFHLIILTLRPIFLTFRLIIYSFRPRSLTFRLIISPLIIRDNLITFHLINLQFSSVNFDSSSKKFHSSSHNFDLLFTNFFLSLSLTFHLIIEYSSKNFISLF